MNKLPLTFNEFFLLLCVDNRSLMMSSRRESILGENITFKQMARMGLKMHVK